MFSICSVTSVKSSSVHVHCAWKFFPCSQVTGGNKGIGYAIVKGLCEKYDGIVYLTARDAGRGEAAISELEKVLTNSLKM